MLLTLGPLRQRLLAAALAGLAGLTVTSGYASAMSMSAKGHIGAGSVSMQASCVTGSASIIPLDSTKVWNTTENFWVYPDLVVSGDFHNCVAGDNVNIAVYVSGSAPTTIAAPYALKAGDISATASFTVTLTTATGTPYLPATAAGVSSYALLIHS